MRMRIHILVIKILCFVICYSIVKYIKKVDGFFGCYRGLVAYLLHKSIFIYCCETFATFFPESYNADEERRIQIQKLLEGSDEHAGGDDGLVQRQTSEDETSETEVYTFRMFLNDLTRDLVCRLGGLTVSYPFLVIAVQTMSAFVGRERVMCRVGWN